MKVKSTKTLRYFIQTKKANDYSHSTDSHFIGSDYQDGNERKKGFFSVIHGIKDDIPSYLQSILKIAEDGQAVYEFIQNAVDCDSTQFWMFYNEDYFLAINNGQPFNQEQIASILNIAQSEKRNLDDDSRCNKIGRFGIGFKLVHRLVGENDGSEELTQIIDGAIKGPTLMSWSHYNQLKTLLEFQEKDPINQLILSHDPEAYERVPWLFKMLLTNFPVAPDERVKDFNYRDFVPFPKSELAEMSSFLKESLGDKLNNKALFSKGSAFFIKLGNNKGRRLKSEQKAIEQGVNYSMQFFNKLQKITVNDIEITKRPIKWLDFEIGRNEEEFSQINPEYKFCPIKFSLGYQTDSTAIALLAEQPNFYKYFPLGDEVNRLCFVIHCDAFDIESNRRKLHNSSINEKLIDALAKRVLESLNEMVQERSEEYPALFLSILLSDANKEDQKNKLSARLMAPLKEFIVKHIPLRAGNGPASGVIIKGFDYPVELAKVGLVNINWFLWDQNSSKEVCEQAEYQLKIAKWGLRHLIINSPQNELETYLKEIEIKDYKILIKELHSEDLINQLREKLKSIRWIKTHNNGLVNLQSIEEGKNFFIDSDNEKLGSIINKLGCDIILLNAPELHQLIVAIGGEATYTEKKTIASWLKEETVQKGLTKLTISERILFKSIIGSQSTDSKDVPLFKSVEGSGLKPLNLLLPFDEHCPRWLDCFRISEEDNKAIDNSLKQQLLKYNEVFVKLFCNKVAFLELTESLNLNEIEEFYDFVVNAIPDLEETKVDYTDIPWVYLDKGEERFDYSKNVYWPDSITKLDKEKYEQVKKAVRKLFNVNLPHFSALKLKSKLKLGSLDLDLSEKLVAVESIGLLRLNYFLDWAETELDNDFLVGLSFKVEKDNCSIEITPERTNYYSLNADLISVISGDEGLKSLQLFPQELYSESRAKIGLLEADTLFEFIFKHSSQLNSYARFIAENASKNVGLNYINALPIISIELNQTYEKKDEVYQIVQIASQAIDNDDEETLNIFRSKVKIDGEALTARSISSDIYFGPRGEKKGFTLATKLSNVLPKYANASISVDKLLDCFPGLKTFHLFKQQRKKIKPICDELFELECDVYSSHQLVFSVFAEYCFGYKSLRDGVPILYGEDTTQQERDILILQHLEVLFQESLATGKCVYLKKDLGLDLSAINLDEKNAFENEKPSLALIEWSKGEGVENRRAFLVQQGVADENSQINLLRQALKGGSSTLDIAWKEIDNSFMFKNTIEWLCDNQNSVELDRTKISNIYEKAAALNLSSDLPLPIRSSIENETYQFKRLKPDTTLYMIHDTWKKFAPQIEKYVENNSGVLIDNLVTYTLRKGYPIVLTTAQRKVDMELLSTSEKLSEGYYLEWPKKEQLDVLVFDGEGIPTIIYIGNEEIAKEFSELAFKYSSAKLYICKKMLAGFPFNAEEYIDENKYNSLVIHKRKYEKEERFRIDFTDEEINLLNDLFDDELPDDFRKNYNLAALINALRELDDLGYEIGQARGSINESHHFAQLSHIYDQDGNEFTIMARSARQGLLYLTRNSWDRLENPNIYLFTDYGKDEFDLFKTKQDILDANDKSVDYQIIRVKTDAKAEQVDQVLRGEYESDKVWVIFKVNNIETFDDLFYDKLQPSDKSLDLSDLGSSTYENTQGW